MSCLCGSEHEKGAGSIRTLFLGCLLSSEIYETNQPLELMQLALVAMVFDCLSFAEKPKKCMN